MRPEHGEDLLDLVGRGAEVMQDRADRVVLLGDDDVLVVLARGACLRLAQQRDVHRHDARLEAQIGIGLIVRRIAEPQRAGAVGTGQRRSGQAGAVGDVAHTLQDFVDRQERRAPHFRQQRTQLARARCGLAARRRCREVAGRERYFGVRLRRCGLIVIGNRRGQKLLRIEGRNLCGNIRDRQRQIAEYALVRPHAHHLALMAAGDGGNAQHFVPDRGLGEGRQPVCLAQTRNMVADVRHRAAQCRANPFGRRRESGLAVQRSENGASHQGGAAKSGQNRPAEPLYRYAAPVEAAMAVDR